MRAFVRDEILFIHRQDVPQYKKGGGTVRNNFFWALRSIACKSSLNQDWEYDSDVWIALCRMLLFFTYSGYLPLSETQLEFSPDSEIPQVLRPISTWGD